MQVDIFALTLTLVVSSSSGVTPPREISFETADGVTIHGHLYVGGPNAVVLAHGGVFNKESWSAQARRLVAAGLTVLAIDFRGYGGVEPVYGLPGKSQDVLGAIDYLGAEGYDRISVVGGSMGGQAAMEASAETDRIDRLVLLAPGLSTRLGAALRARSILFIVSAGDRFRDQVDQAYRDAPEPKRLEILAGSAHAQHLFATAQGEALTELIVGFLTAE